MDLKKPQFLNAGSDPFTIALRAKTEIYFKTRNLSSHFDARMIAKTVFYFSLFLAVYLFLMFSADASGWILSLAAIALGVIIAGIAFNVGHDAIHEGYSSHSRWNTFLGHSFTLMGANVYIWKTLHNVIHHSYTNIPGADGDLHPVPLLRFCEKTELKPVHRFQYLYAPFLYSLTSLVWVFKKDFSFIRKKSHFVYKMPQLNAKVIAELVIGKVLYFGIFLGLPLAIYGAQWPQVLVGFLLMHLSCGLCLAMVFQLGHLVEKVEFPTLYTDGKMQDSWAVHQLKTSSNFSPNSPIARWFCGGLNNQIEHHLFPRVCHSHYKGLAQIVKETAKEFNLPYTEYPTFFAALRSHQRHMWKMGRPLVAEVRYQIS